MKRIVIVICSLICTNYHCVEATLFDFGVGVGGTSFPLWDQYVRTIDLQYSFKFAGSAYSTLYISDDGVVSFSSDATTFLNNDNLLISDQWLAPLEYDFISGTIWHARYSGADSQLQTASDIVNEANGNTNFVAAELTVVTWDITDDVDIQGAAGSFQLALAQNSQGSQSYVIFIYGNVQITGAVTVGISLGDNVKRVLAWNGVTQTLAACDSSVTSTVRQFPQRSQTGCGTRAGVLVFSVIDSANFLTDPVCTFVPQSGCSTTNQNKINRCKARRKRRQVNDL